MIYMVSSNALCCFSHSKTVWKMYMPSHKSHDNFQNQGVIAVNHMNHDVAEVNCSDPPMFPGSFLYKKEPGYKAMVTVCEYKLLG